ncbi:hypothetical protein ACG7TL_006527 [Trametes sanguinea]
MASGVGVNPECLEAYQELKLGKKTKYIIFTLNKDNTEIVVEKKSPLTSTYDDFLADLPEGECRWAVYDFDFEKEDGGKRSKITFYSCSPLATAHACDTLRRAWGGEDGGRSLAKKTGIADGCCVIYATRAIAPIRSPDDSKVKQKMLFASSKDALRRSLVGIAAEIQGTDYSEVAHENVLDKVSKGH